MFDKSFQNRIFHWECLFEMLGSWELNIVMSDSFIKRTEEGYYVANLKFFEGFSFDEPIWYLGVVLWLLKYCWKTNCSWFINLLKTRSFFKSNQLFKSWIRWNLLILIDLMIIIMNWTCFSIQIIWTSTAFSALIIRAVLTSNLRTLIWRSTINDSMTPISINGIVIQINQFLLSNLFNMIFRKTNLN